MFHWQGKLFSQYPLYTLQDPVVHQCDLIEFEPGQFSWEWTRVQTLALAWPETLMDAHRLVRSHRICWNCSNFQESHRRKFLHCIWPDGQMMSTLTYSQLVFDRALMIDDESWRQLSSLNCCPLSVPSRSYLIPALTLSLLRVLSSKLRKKSWISFCKILKNKQHHMKVLLNSLHLNGHTLGFHPQI